MNRSTRLIVTTAALAGLYAGSLATRSLGATNDSKAGTTAKDDAMKGKHDCKGKNSCKGEGGCGTSDNGCKGKNSCKGKGGCATAMADTKKEEPKKDAKTDTKKPV